MESRSFGPSNKSKTKEKTPPIIDQLSDDITMPIVWFVLQIVVKFAHLNQW